MAENEAAQNAAEALNAALQRSHSTPEPLFGHLEFAPPGQPGASNGKVKDYGKKKAFVLIFWSP